MNINWKTKKFWLAVVGILVALASALGYVLNPKFVDVLKEIMAIRQVV